MAQCELLGNCIFFNDKMQNMPATANILKVKFCQDDYSGCARYMVFLAFGKAGVPDDLYPHQAEKAAKLIGRGQARFSPPGQTPA